MHNVNNSEVKYMHNSDPTKTDRNFDEMGILNVLLGFFKIKRGYQWTASKLSACKTEIW